MDYFSLKFNLIEVDKKDQLRGPVERWEAHKKGILHRGFTCIIKNDYLIVIQKRKHKIFNNVFDLSFSSHPLFLKKNPQKIEEAIKENFKREWKFKGKILELKFLEKYYYKIKDEQTGFFEHEINYLYLLKLKGKIINNPQFSYGMDLLTSENLIKKFTQFNFAPWIKKISLKNIVNYLNL